MGTNVRLMLATMLAEQLPDTWAVFAHGLTLENPQHPTVVVRQTSLQRTRGAPRIYRDAGFTVGLIEPGIGNLAQLENALDSDLAILIDALEAIHMPGLTWQEAQRVTFVPALNGYDIHLTITTEKD
jgi:hypothetical protein